MSARIVPRIPGSRERTTSAQTAAAFIAAYEARMAREARRAEQTRALEKMVSEAHRAWESRVVNDGSKP